MNISVNISGINDVIKNLDPQIVKASMFRAINRTVDGVSTDVSKEVRQTYNIRRDDINRRIKKSKPRNYDSLAGSVTIEDKLDGKSAIPLIIFKAVGRQNLASGGSVKTMKGKNGFISQRLKRAGNAGVSYKVLQAGGKGFSANAFIIPGGGGSLQVVTRVKGAKGNKGLKEKRVVSPMQMVKGFRHGVLDKIMKQADNRFMKNMLHELARRS